MTNLTACMDSFSENMRHKFNRCLPVDIDLKISQMNNPILVDFLNVAGYFKYHDLVVLGCREVALRIKEKL